MAGGGGLVLVVVGASVVVVVETSTSKAAVRIRRLPPTMSSERSTLRPGDSKLISTQSGARVLVEAVQPAAGDMALTSRRVDVRFTVAEPASSAGTCFSSPTASASKLACGSAASVAAARSSFGRWVARWSLVMTPEAASAPAIQVAPRALKINMSVSFRRLGVPGPRSRRRRPIHVAGRDSRRSRRISRYLISWVSHASLKPGVVPLDSGRTQYDEPSCGGPARRG